MVNPDVEKYLKDESWMEKFQKIKVRKKLYNISRGVAIFIIIVALVLLTNRIISFFQNTHIFGKNSIIVQGNKFLSVNDILQSADIVNIKNIFKVNLKEVEKKLEMHPRIKEVYVKKKLPNYLVIKIREREPVALINIKKDFLYKIYEVDNDGYIIGEGDRISNYNLPIITGLESDNIILGVKIKDDGILNLLKILDRINKKVYNFDRLIAEVDLKDSDSENSLIMILSKNNVPVILGVSNMYSKLIKLNSLLSVISDRIKDIRYIDFKYNDAVIMWQQ